VLQNVYISLPYITAARTTGIDRNEESTLPSPCILLFNLNVWN